MIRALALAVVLLSAQQLALAHAVSHFDGKPQDPGQQRLCELHSAMDAVLGAVDAPCVAALPEQPASPRFRAASAGEPG